jgi:hypothetical protein
MRHEQEKKKHTPIETPDLWHPSLTIPQIFESQWSFCLHEDFKRANSQDMLRDLFLLTVGTRLHPLL